MLHAQAIDELETVVQSRGALMLSKVKRFWWWLWTGDSSESATRRRVEEEARRFGGLVLWGEQAEAVRELVSAARYALEHADPRLRYVEPQVDKNVARLIVMMNAL